MRERARWIARHVCRLVPTLPPDMTQQVDRCLTACSHFVLLFSRQPLSRSCTFDRVSATHRVLVVLIRQQLWLLCDRQSSLLYFRTSGSMAQTLVALRLPCAIPLPQRAVVELAHAHDHAHDHSRRIVTILQALHSQDTA